MKAHNTHLAAYGIELKPMYINCTVDLLEAAKDGELWNLWYTWVPNAQNVHEYVDQALLQQDKGTAIPYLIYKDGKLIGTSRFCNIDSPNRRLEIGYTWYAKTYQRTEVNTVCKYLLLREAFENLDAIAVEFRTHWHNQASRNAILRLGAKQDGILRSHRIETDGGRRDTVVFSILDLEWPNVRKSLLMRLMSLTA